MAVTIFYICSYKMRRKIFTYLIVFLLGMFLMPQESYACNMKMNSTSHKTITSKKETTKNCCDKKSSSNKNKGCNKSCGDSKCQCSSFGSCTSLVFAMTIESNNYSYVSSTEKENNFFYNALINKVFFSVWAPPKIS